MKLCFLCGKKIGLLRSFVDQQYCSPEHRKEARLASSQAYRDEDDLENWAVAKRNKKGQMAKPTATVAQNASVLAFLFVGGLLILALMLPGPGTPSAAFPSVSHDPAVKRGIIERVGDSFSEMVRSSAPITLQHDFSKGMTDWTTAALKASPIDDPKDWLGGTRESSNSAPSRSVLHIWERSATLQNYQIEFQGQIDHKTLSWAFRASDGGNYYADKLVINKSGPGPNAELVRYAVVGGKEFEKPERKNIPVHIDPGVDFRIRTIVQDDRFLTYLNAQLIQNWTDKRLGHGGVGFFEDSTEPQKVSWVSVSERDSFIGRMLAHFSLFIIPSAN